MAQQRVALRDVIVAEAKTLLRVLHHVFHDKNVKIFHIDDPFGARISLNMDFIARGTARLEAINLAANATGAPHTIQGGLPGKLKTIIHELICCWADAPSFLGNLNRNLMIPQPNAGEPPLPVISEAARRAYFRYFIHRVHMPFDDRKEILKVVPGNPPDAGTVAWNELNLDEALDLMIGELGRMRSLFRAFQSAMPNTVQNYDYDKVPGYRGHIAAVLDHVEGGAAIGQVVPYDHPEIVWGNGVNRANGWQTERPFAVNKKLFNDKAKGVKKTDLDAFLNL